MIEIDIRVVDVARLDASRWNRARWAAGVVAASLCTAAALAPPESNAGRRALYMMALLAVEAFGTLTATLMLMEAALPIVARITNWTAFVASGVVWFIGLTTDLWAGMTAGEGLLLALSVGATFAWIALAAIGRRT